MDNKTQVIKHLEMIQGIINRLGSNSFLVKGWSMTLLIAGVMFIVERNIQNNFIILAFLIPAFGFWMLDGYFLNQERLFREGYNKIRKQDDTDFNMNFNNSKNNSKNNFINSIFSKTLSPFYGIEFLFILVIYLWSQCFQ